MKDESTELAGIVLLPMLSPPGRIRRNPLA